MNGPRHIFLNPLKPDQILLETGPEISAGKYFFYDDVTGGLYTSGRELPSDFEQTWIEYIAPDPETATPLAQAPGFYTGAPAIRRVYLNPEDLTTVAFETGPEVYGPKFMLFNEQFAGSPSDGVREKVEETWLPYTAPTIPAPAPDVEESEG